MNFSEIFDKISSLASRKGGLGNSIKFATDQGNIHISADGVVTNTDSPADCTISVKASDLAELMTGKLNPMTAVMFGKIKIAGDMSIAMKLQSLF
ncbi:SCP2 sterol-binding domain-containing protein [Flectobacillus rivi]|jgi:putative sterol carrier protein|uniref:SCP2 sterol-binding domain-containing protein n=1 Tax=Flectobacillus rivi TaxID=2984209 RepID=A0ABT6YWC3_9BACT|nr:SCP2 sterol-binding domain-containing protein [Flectobacillus rivi]MDI9873177.1 SCP2 sterol-binding domain-containing protein [Flectobacillus rivi]